MGQINAQIINDMLTANLRDPARNNYEGPRMYLGMSEIGQDQYELFQGLLARFRGEETPIEDRMHWYNWTGNFCEAELIKALEAQGLKPAEGGKQRTVVADFDPRFRGHVDYVAEDNTLLEMKTITWYGFAKLRDENRPRDAHVAQVQAYMRHGGFDRAVIIYYARDVPYRVWDGVYKTGWVEAALRQEHTPALWAFEVEPHQTYQSRLDEKARSILVWLDEEMGDDGRTPN